MIAFYARAGNEADYGKLLDVLQVGDLAPDRYSYYVKLQSSRDIYLLPRYHVALLLAKLYGEENAPTALPANTATK